MTYIPKAMNREFNTLVPQLITSGYSTEGQFNAACVSLIEDKYNMATTLGNSWGSLFDACLKYYSSEEDKYTLITQSNTFYGDVMIARQNGFNIVYVPGDPTDPFNMDHDELLKAIEYLDQPENAILLVSHINGHANKNTELLATTAEHYGITIVEDCAHSWGVVADFEATTKLAGTFGETAIFSFYATKFLNAGEGGALITSNDELSEYMTQYVKYSRELHHTNESVASGSFVPEAGNNIRISEYQAIALKVALENEDEYYTARLAKVNKYLAAFDHSDIFDPLNKLADYEDSLSQTQAQYYNFYKFYVKDTEAVRAIITEQGFEIGSSAFNYECPIIDAVAARVSISVADISVYEQLVSTKKNYISLKTI
ncbi:DegT/DnrJ/EryC1/StrS aminotransferase family protein [Maribacter phage Molly_5]|uniref:DegT/DnrJ/EryC1/StrS aminotransferase family protein n=2 Tax=Mollyvirus TaxID=2948826 RepID=A0A8E4UXS3_9CAUD|nr:aminotransferase [Maribacter phage Molly_1]YP_010357362.1 aminotransferase [Maribacter phage Colly_1]QQO97606.1 DegT/DnrJ/EryC1/StrS aminotransferase family protein [Maribacter phage Molly_2]QQO97806.1 DegT/DnrJ/EryC1/StrS aminotransferase family protein [Maribacter phage Molly_3]QQO98007.1 DegT/DnrJ/EryC1/StrS aminotransferase family protein [Maribacter phage Molly_4]QQO98207.1 DegT/DnrJ/EryC1/StrS aminotransferase family protein [Maribacter phage Molly_5]QQO97211.1 DegT/DnrJ/EryC1/StrS a